MNNPENAGWLMQIANWIWAGVLGLMAVIYKLTHTKIDGKADKEAFDRLSSRVENHTINKATFDEHVSSDEKQLASINDELGVQRGHIGKIFDRMTQMDENSHSRHIELLNAIHGKKK